MRIREARICFDCDYLTTGQYCPVCGKQVSWHLSTWLDRRPDDVGNNGEEIKHYPEDNWRLDR